MTPPSLACIMLTSHWCQSYTLVVYAKPCWCWTKQPSVTLHLMGWYLHCRSLTLPVLISHLVHAAMNNIIHRTLTSAKVSSHLEPSGLHCWDGKPPDGITKIPWRNGKLLVWDATSPDTSAPSYVSRATSETGAVAALAEDRKRTKYTCLEPTCTFTPIAIETSGVFGPLTLQFLKDLDNRLRQATGDKNLPTAKQHHLYWHFVGRENVMWLTPSPSKHQNDVIFEKIVWRRPLTDNWIVDECYIDISHMDSSDFMPIWIPYICWIGHMAHHM